MTTDELLKWLKGDHCQCHEAYTKRKLTDPNCWYCDYGDYLIEAAGTIESLKAEVIEAIKPFALMSEYINKNNISEGLVMTFYCETDQDRGRDLVYGDFRRLAALCEKLEGK